MMRSVTRFLAWSMPIPAAVAVVLMFAAPAALAGTVKAVDFSVQPTTTQVNTAMTPAVVVDVIGSNGQVATWFNGQVTLTYAVNSVGAPEPANNMVDAVDGVATFPDLTFSAVGFGFELQASAGNVTSSPSEPFNIVTQLVHCQSDQACQSGTVSSAGTSGSITTGAASTSDVLTATGGGFPDLSCTSIGGVLTFTVTNRAKTITLMLAKSLVQQIGPGASHFNICWGAPMSFLTKDGTWSTFNSVNNEYEGLLPYCSKNGPSPCIASQHKTKAGVEVTTVSAPSGDPRGTY